MKDFSGGFKLFVKFLIFNGSMNFSQNYLSIVNMFSNGDSLRANKSEICVGALWNWSMSKTLSLS